MRVAALVGLVSDERTEMLFKLSQVSGDVALVEVRVLIVLHVCCNAVAETSLNELLGHVFHHVLNFVVFALDVFAFLLTELDLVSKLLGQVAHIIDFVGKLLLVHVSHFVVAGDLRVNLVVLSLDGVAFLAHQVNVREKGVILLLGLDEGSNNFIDVGDA